MYTKKHLYLIDSNILIDIRDLNKGIENEETLSINQFDKSDSIVSPILAIVEGKTGALQTTNQMREHLSNVVKEIEVFYKNAKTDVKFLSKFTDYYINFFGEIMKNKLQEIIPPMIDLQKILYRDYEVSEAKNILNCIGCIAKKHKISIRHPMFYSAIYHLYGNVAAKNVFKKKINPNEKTAHNAAFDIRLLMSFLHLRQIFQSLDKNLEIHLFTRDKNLNVLRQVLCIDAENTSSETATDISCKIKIEFMPSLFNKTPKTQECHLNEIENLFNKNISRDFYSVLDITVSFVKPPRA